ncbi:hypothetical protein ACFRQM_00740 [Streptomyces sp. NPDC056831]|uniref:hypothetical protein n=1 Tax=Streptomyces sp. NPDC056831 TaxID=3345954 RepID=UPI0036923F1C
MADGSPGRCDRGRWSGDASLPQCGHRFFLFCVVPAFVLVPAAEAYATGRKQREERESSIQTFGSVGELRQIIDGPGFRRIRDESGQLGALRKIKRQYPGIPIDMDATLFKEL